MLVKVERVSPLTGKTNFMVINTTQDQIDEWNSPERKTLIQDIFHDLTVDEREFIQTGYTPQDWETIEEQMKEVMEDD